MTLAFFACNKTISSGLDAGLSNESTFSLLRVGAQHTCGISSVGDVFCWGHGGYNALGYGPIGTIYSSPSPSAADRDVPTRVEVSPLMAGESFIKLSDNSAYNNFAITNLGRAFAWGKNESGELGDGTLLGKNAPVLIDTSNLSSGETFVSISGGTQHTCGLSNNNTAFCWGDNSASQLGTGGASVSIPTQVNTSVLAAGETFTKIAAGPITTCAISSSGKAYCWGAQLNGELGNGDSVTPHPTPTPVTMPSANFVDIGLGYLYACALGNDGNIYCWGDEANGKIGNGIMSGSINIPTQVDTSALPIGTSFVNLSVGGQHSCGLTNKSTVYCWGLNLNGQIGDGSILSRSIPTLSNTSHLPLGTSIISINLGAYHSCGLSNVGTAYCWGYNAFGQLGDGSTADRSTPIQVEF